MGAVGEISAARQLVRRKEFADLQGWAPSYVTKLAHQDRLVMTDDGKLIDVQASLARIHETASIERQSVVHANERRRALDGVAPPELPPELPLVAPEVKGDASPPAAAPRRDQVTDEYNAARARRESSLAAIAEMELRSRAGDLVDRETVEREQFSVARQLRDRLLALPPALAIELVGVADVATIERRIREELRGALEAFAKGLV